MKTLRLITILITVFVINVHSQTNWEKVEIVHNSDDVKGMTRLGEVNQFTSKPFGREIKLRATTIEKIKKEAAKLGATMVLIAKDKWVMQPVNKITIVGTAYK